MLPNVCVARAAASTPDTFAGLDGCRGGWILASWRPAEEKLDLQTFTTLAELAPLPQPPACIVVDMPLVLEKVAVAGGRRCDREARALLPKGRKGSMFSAPTRAALEVWRLGGGYREVLAAQRQTGPGAPGLSLQAFHLLKAIDDLQRFVAAFAPKTCLEGHPELAFDRQRRASDAPLVSKHKACGRQQRQQVLTRLGLPWFAAWSARRRSDTKAVQAGMGDALDACILAHVSHQHHLGLAKRCPTQAPQKGCLSAIYF